MFRQGDQVKIVAPGGGGWGNPLEREAERVLQDVIEGFVTPEAALREYGVQVIQHGPGEFMLAEPARPAKEA